MSKIDELAVKSITELKPKQLRLVNRGLLLRKKQRTNDDKMDSLRAKLASLELTQLKIREGLTTIENELTRG